MKFRPYPEYKDSGLEWIEVIPKTWKIHRIKRLGSLSTSGVDKKSNPEEIKIKLVNYMDVYKSLDKKIDSSLNFMNVTARPQQLLSNDLRSGDVLFTPSSETPDDIGNSAVVFEDLKNTLHSYHLIRLRFNGEIKLTLNYKRYLFNNHFILNQFSSKCVGITRMILGIPGFGESYSLIPPLEDQKQITNFLDKKTSEIDLTIEKDTRLIELLKEKRTSLINHVVTKGLDPTVKMKDSGVEWIGEIPEEWEVRKIKTFSVVRRGASPRPIDDPKYFDENGEYSWVRISDVTVSSKYLYNTTEKLSVVGKSFSVPLEPGELFISIAGSVGKPIITKIKCCIHDGFVYFQDLKLDPEYLYYIFIGGQAFQGLGKLGTQLNLNTETIGNIKISHPSEKEQSEITQFLDKKTSEINVTIEKIEEKINLLEEYKKSLIHHVVTGKVDVREVAV